LHLACSYGQLDEARVLLEHGACIDSMGYKKQTALHKACAVGEHNLVAMLIEATVQVIN
jgi:ankyrin repeat protein